MKYYTASRPISKVIAKQVRIYSSVGPGVIKMWRPPSVTTTYVMKNIFFLSQFLQ
jgi:hypothetical protein